MALSDHYLQTVLASKDRDLAVQEAGQEPDGRVVSWAICDGALIVYDDDDPPSWMPSRDEDGNSIEIDGGAMTVPGRARIEEAAGRGIWRERDTSTGRFPEAKATGGTFTGVRKER